MKVKTFAIVSELDNLGIPLDRRSFLLSLAYARALGYALALPTSPVENLYGHFTDTHKAAVEDVLAQINEKIVIDIDATVDLTQRIWAFRYRMVFDANNAAVRQFMDAMVKVGSRELPPKVSEWMISYEANDILERLARTVSLCTEGA